MDREGVTCKSYSSVRKGDIGVSDFLEFMSWGGIGVVVGLIVFFVPGQSKASKRVATGILCLCCAFPAGIVFLVLTRNAYGESYAWIILGGMWGCLTGAIGGILFLVWMCILINHKR